MKIPDDQTGKSVDEIRTALLLQLTKSVADFGLHLAAVADAQNHLVQNIERYVPAEVKRDLLAQSRQTYIQIGALKEKLELLREMVR